MAGIEAGILNVLIAPKLVSDFASKLGIDLKDGVGDAGEKAGESLGKRLGEGFTKTGKDLTKKVTAPIVAGFGLLIANALKVDEAFDTIRAQTGKTGAEADKLQESFKKVASNSAAPLNEVADNIAKLSVQFENLSGKPLEALSTAFIQLKEVTGEALDEKAFADVAKRFKIPADKLTGSLDQLLRGSQLSGIGIGQLTSSLETNAAVLTELGFDYVESIALIGKLEKAGFNAAQVLGGLRKAYLTAIGADDEAAVATENIAKATDDRSKAEAELAVAQLRLQELQAKGLPGAKEAGKEQERIAKITAQITKKKEDLALAELKLQELSQGKGPANAAAAQLKIQEKLRLKTADLQIAQQKLNEKLADPKAAQSAVSAARLAVEKVTSEIASLKAEAAKPVELKFAPDSAVAAAQLAAKRIRDDIARLETDAAKTSTGRGSGAAGSEILAQQNKIAELQATIDAANGQIVNGQTELANAAKKSGISIGEFTLNAIADIKKLSEAGDEAAANARAKELFGRSALEVLQGIEAGAFDFTALAKEIEFGTETVGTAFAAVVDFPQQLEIFRNRLSIALQPIGAQLFPVIEKSIATVLPLVEKLINLFTSLPDGVQTTILVLAGLAAAVGPVLVGIGQMITAFVALTASQAASAVAATVLRVALAAIGIGLIIAAIVLLIQNWDTVKKVSLAAIEKIKEGIKFAVDFIKNNWKNLLIILTGPFAPAIAIITKNWDRIKEGALGALNGVKNILSGVGNAISKPFVDGINSALKFLTALRNGAGTVVKSIIGFFSQMASGIAAAIAKVLKLPGFSTVAKVASSLSGAIGFLPGLATGGPMAANQPYIVGEKGPEIVVPKSNGYVLPNNVLNGLLGGSTGSAANYTVNVYNPVAETSAESIPAALRRANLLRSNA
jgi:phage-related minor tail protein